MKKKHLLFLFFSNQTCQAKIHWITPIALTKSANLKRTGESSGSINSSSPWVVFLIQPRCPRVVSKKLSMEFVRLDPFSKKGTWSFEKAYRKSSKILEKNYKRPICVLRFCKIRISAS
ncbi:hypothetical protein BCV72DRAFT_94147 [Rhizopus microsporus var. microsporus]|uniref:Uncharacterized protein n=1 Tax=Rhizopus microsporus var. microsporus TaxID=86635 RepID=A0A1X0RHI9_RHIZD|nr:hypothetical protein BCV72DRAFT_94147 [Rhizopus microsporus var. microsporus]